MSRREPPRKSIFEDLLHVIGRLLKVAKSLRTFER